MLILTAAALAVSSCREQPATTLGRYLELQNEVRDLPCANDDRWRELGALRDRLVKERTFVQKVYRVDPPVMTIHDLNSAGSRLAGRTRPRPAAVIGSAWLTWTNMTVDVGPTDAGTVQGLRLVVEDRPENVPFWRNEATKSGLMVGMEMPEAGCRQSVEQWGRQSGTAHRVVLVRGTNGTDWLRVDEGVEQGARTAR